jgi:23S rRNA pseudouridine1911/1915/1917 synthase
MAAQDRRTRVIVPRLTVRLPEGGRRLDSLLASLLQGEGLSRSRVQRMIEEGLVTVDGVLAKASAGVREGQVVVLEAPEPRPSGIVPMECPLTILYEDESCIAVDKPSGLVTHPAKGHWDDTLVNALAATGRTFSSGSAPDRPGILHRLDKETSGILLVAKTDRAHAALAQQFRDRSLHKVYLALAWGALLEDPVVVDAPIGRHPQKRKKMAVREDGRAARTEFHMRQALPHVTLVEARPLTGRTHQVRLHLAHLHHPVVGDVVYGGHPENGLPSKALQEKVKCAGRFFLHAHRLTFESPDVGVVVVESPLPGEFMAMMEAFRTHG